MRPHAPTKKRPTLHLQLLGDFRLEYEGGLVTAVKTPRLQSLLAYLVLHRDAPQSRQHLSFLLWPDSTEQQARTNLRKLLHELRRALPDPQRWLHADTHTLQWRPDAPFGLDVAKFEDALTRAARAGDPAAETASLEQAVDLYRGDLLPSCYDDWILPERERLRQAFTQALERLIGALEAQRAYQHAISYVQLLLRHNPLHEAGYRRLLRLHALNGDRAGALRAYHACATVLEQELGVEPSSATREAYQRLVRLEETPATAPEPAARATPLIGREAEWEQLQAAWRRASGGTPHLALVSGEAGIGKTRLAEELLSWAGRQGVPTANARCYASGGKLAYAPVTAWLRAGALRERLTALEPLWLTELARLLPELLVEQPDLPQPEPLIESWQQQRLFEALVQPFLARRPLLLLIDDLHWGDRETLAWLAYLLRARAPGGLLVLATLRTEALSGDPRLSTLLRDLRRGRQLTEVELGPLDQEDVGALASSLAGHALDGTLAAALYDETEGNPLFVVESVRAGLPREADGSPAASRPWPMPGTVQAVIAGRLARLSPAARELVDVAATIGRAFPFEILSHASTAGPDTLVQALDELWQRRIILEQENDYTFSHDKIREFAYRSLSAARKRLLHRQVVQAIQAQASIAGQDRFALLAHHYAQANDRAQALHYLLLAGDQARHLHAFETAINFYQRALTLQKECQAHTAAFRTLMKIGLSYQARFEFEQAQQAFDAGFAHIQKTTTRLPDLPTTLPPQTLRVVSRAPLSFDPTRGQDYGSTRIIDQLFSGLVELAPDMTIVPAVARRWELLDAGRTYLFHLRQDARWSDGRAVTASDFVCAWERLLDPAFPSSLAGTLDDVQGARARRFGSHAETPPLGVRAAAPDRLVIQLTRPNSYFIFLLAKPLTFPVPGHRLERYGDAWAETDKLVTNGPFQLESIDDKALTLVRSTTYHGHMTGNVERIVYRWVDTWETRLRLYEKGEIDVLSLWNLPPHEMHRVRQRQASDYVTGPWFQNTFIGLNAGRAPLDDVRVRRALVHALDRDSLSHQVKYGYDAPASGGFVPPGMFGHSPDIGLPRDPTRAQQLLSRAGYPGGRGFPRLYGIMYEAYQPLQRHLADQWRTTLGIDVRWELLSWPEFQDRARRATADLVFSGWVADYPDPDNMLRIALHTAQSGWQDERFNELVERAKSLKDPNERRGLYQEADQILIDQVGLIPISYGRWHLLVKPHIEQFPICPLKHTFWKDVLLEPSVS